MDKYVNLDELINLIKNKKVSDRPRTWLKPEGVPENTQMKFFEILAEFDDFA